MQYLVYRGEANGNIIHYILGLSPYYFLLVIWLMQNFIIFLANKCMCTGAGRGEDH